MNSLATDISNILRDARISPRILAALSGVHFTSIYNILKRGEGAKVHKSMEMAVVSAMNDLAALLDSGKLPLGDLRNNEKLAEIQRLLNSQD